VSRGLESCNSEAYAEALADAQQALLLCPNNWRAHWLKVRALEHLGSLDAAVVTDAIEACRAALAHGEDCHEALRAIEALQSHPELELSYSLGFECRHCGEAFIGQRPTGSCGDCQQDGATADGHLCKGCYALHKRGKVASHLEATELRDPAAAVLAALSAESLPDHCPSHPAEPLMYRCVACRDAGHARHGLLCVACMSAGGMHADHAQGAVAPLALAARSERTDLFKALKLRATGGGAASSGSSSPSSVTAGVASQSSSASTPRVGAPSAVASLVILARLRAQAIAEAQSGLRTNIESALAAAVTWR
jgi:hypothetical protein